MLVVFEGCYGGAVELSLRTVVDDGGPVAG